uniref:Phthiocerol/phthiodiolone dimycocerosyl transferase C-terminal domain-containing protein n=1 Tax=Oryza brachyantha TaxID=4533 RepID=J3L632_ORYBR
MVGYSINGLRTSTLPFEVTGTERSTQMLRLGFDREETTRLLDACKQNGVKLCSAMAAATLLAARQAKQLKSDDQQETYSIAILINCRKFLEPALDDHNVGFFHSAITNTHTVHGGEGLWELAKRCQDSYASAKNSKKHLTDISDLNFLMCRAIENPQLTTATALRTAVVSVFEEPVVYELSDLQGKAGVEEFVCGATVHGVGPSIGLFDSIRDGQLELACMYPCPLHSRKQMQEIMNKVKQILHEGSIGDDENFEDCT